MLNFVGLNYIHYSISFPHLKILKFPHNTDGYMNFLDLDTLAIASYPKEWRRKQLNFLKELKTKVRRPVKNLVELKENPTEEMNGSIFSAKGSYVNFLKLGFLENWKQGLF